MDVTMMPIGAMRTPFAATGEIPKGPDAKHDAEGVIEIEPSFEAGLQDIEGFSHLYVLWHFHRIDGYALVAYPPSDDTAGAKTKIRPGPFGCGNSLPRRKMTPRSYSARILMELSR